MNKNVYNIFRKIHLYASLSIVALLVMYVVSSYLMIHYKLFQTYDQQQEELEIEVGPAEISGDNWNKFLTKNHVSGRLTKENVNSSGDLVREYNNASANFKVTLNKAHDLVKINTRKKNAAGTIAGIHRISGFGGPLKYNLYAILLDVVGVSLILFAITGMILWLKLLKNDPIAWIVLISGFVYFGAVLTYLLVV